MRAIATWNVNSLRVRLPQLAEWLAANPVHTIALQETKLEDAAFPRAEIEALGYHVAASGQRTYNGVAILARAPLHDVQAGIPGFDDPQRRVLAATIDGVRVVNLYVPNGQSVGSEKYAYKLRWLAALRDWLREELARHPRLIALGDFNIAPEDRDVHDPAAWAGSVHVSEPERAALRELLALGLADSFRLFEQPPGTYSWWDYRQGAFRRNNGLRIDLLLVSDALAKACSQSVIDREPRRAERPSDHAPAIASFDI
ncbi:MAG: exodeoxyribonuclease III [Steroidobacteraceae bacterium]|nr:exodeoxyribonuclease III [Steroidobacteraceae bacterium]MCW5573406.1 exodeoxyribonuclease III [Steroidobacteraceae bacterium]